MAREIWLRAKVYSVIVEKGELRPLARCGLHQTGPNLIWAAPCLALDIESLECWARGIVNSSNTALVELEQGYAPLGRADGPARVEYGMQVRELTNEISRDGAIEFLPERKHAEKMCLLRSKFPGISHDLADILLENGLKPEYLDVRQLNHLATVVRMICRERQCGSVTLPDEIIRQMR